MGIIRSNKTVSVQRIDCNGTFDVQLSLTAAPDIVANPADIVMVLDRSGSMAGQPLEALQEASKRFIQIIAQAVGGLGTATNNGTRVGLVSFASNVQITPLGSTSTALDTAIDALTAGGSTNHSAAFTAAHQMLENSTAPQKVVILFTDGVTTEGGSADAITTLIKSQGAVIYAIGLEGDTGLDLDALERWASSPASSYVAVASDPADLLELFADLARNITKPGATNILLTDQVNDCFRIVALSAPSKGGASLLNNTTIQWQIDQLGATQIEGATLTFTVRHVGDCSGSVEVNEDIDYSDAENNQVVFPSPQILVDCGIVVPEDCPQPVAISMTGCQGSAAVDAGEIAMEGQGSLLQLSVTLQGVCRGRQVALAAVLSEVDSAGVEHPRGMKVLQIPAHDRPTCQDVTVECIHFVLPAGESLAGAPCATRNFRARFFANYTDGGLACCSQQQAAAPRSMKVF